MKERFSRAVAYLRDLPAAVYCHLILVVCFGVSFLPLSDRVEGAVFAVGGVCGSIVAGALGRYASAELRRRRRQ